MSEHTSESGFSPREARALASVLDEIIPPSDDGRFPGAGQAGLAHYIEQNAPEFRPTIVQSLSVLDELANARGAPDFAALSRENKLGLLNELATAQPAFLPGLILHTYAGYYQNDRVLEALGLEPRPPYPDGYKMEPSDLSLLDGVRRRGKLYRD